MGRSTHAIMQNGGHGEKLKVTRFGLTLEVPEELLGKKGNIKKSSKKTIDSMFDKLEMQAELMFKEINLEYETYLEEEII